MGSYPTLSPLTGKPAGLLSVAVVVTMTRTPLCPHLLFREATALVWLPVPGGSREVPLPDASGSDDIRPLNLNVNLHVAAMTPHHQQRRRFYHCRIALSSLRAFLVPDFSD